MIDTPAQQPSVNPKMTQFLQELNALCDRYQYSLVPKANAFLRVVDQIPPKETPKPVEEPKPVQKTPAKK